MAAVWIIVFAPLACVRFCELRAAAERAHAYAVSPSNLALVHLHGRHGGHDHSHTDPAGRPPLNELKQTMTDVTELLIAPGRLIAIAMVALVLGIDPLLPRRQSLDVPTPPPRSAYMRG
jgi:hypothetical protein